MTFDPFAPGDLSSEEVFDRAMSALSGVRTATVLGAAMPHKNADWLFPNDEIIVEHKQIETDFSRSDSFREREVELRRNYIRSRRANILGVPYDSKAFDLDYIRLYQKSFAKILGKANVQIRETRNKLNWPKGRGILILSNKSLFKLTPLAICMLVQGILEGAYSEIGGAAYVPNHYVDIPGSNLANLAWFPIYKHGGKDTSHDFIRFVDSFGERFLNHFRNSASDIHPVEQHRADSDEAFRIMRAKAIVPRS